MSKSMVYLVASYARDVCGMKTFTSLDLYHLAPCAQLWYDSRLPADTWDNKRAILAKHGFDEESWKTVIDSSGLFYFSPSPSATDCNNEIKQLFKPLTILNRVPYYPHYCRAKIHNALTAKTPPIEYADRTKQPFTYRLKETDHDDPR